MNLAYIPSAPTRAALAFDAVVSTFNIYGGAWEAGAGAIFAENEALAWLVDLLGWPQTAGGCFVSGGTIGNLSALVAARQTMRTRRGKHPRGQWRIACTAQAHSSVQGAAVGAGRRGGLGRRGRRRSDDRRSPAGRADRRSGRVRGGRLGRHHQRRHRRRPDLGRRGLRRVRRLAARRRRVRRGRAGRAQRPTGVRRHRAGRQLHRRPAQVAVRPVRLLRAGLSPARAGPGRARPARQLSGRRSTGRSGTRGIWPPICPDAAAGCRSGSAWPCTAPTVTPRRSSSRWPRPGRSPGASRRSRSSGWCWSRPCRWWCSSGRAGPRPTTRPGRASCPARA